MERKPQLRPHLFVIQARSRRLSSSTTGRSNFPRATSRIVLPLVQASILAIIRHRNPGDHREVALIEGYEIRAVLFGGCGDQGVRQTSTVAPSVISPVEPTASGRLLRHG